MRSLRPYLGIKYLHLGSQGLQVFALYTNTLSYSLIFLTPISVPEMHIVWMVRALCLSSVLNTLKCTMATFLSLSLQVLQTALPEFLRSEKRVRNRMSTQVKKLCKVSEAG